jgi:hypothetical protein
MAARLSAEGHVDQRLVMRITTCLICFPIIVSTITERRPGALT